MQPCLFRARDMRASRRISVRLPDAPMERLREYCCEANSDVSRAVRQALDAFLAVESGSGSHPAVPKRRTPPEQVFDLVPKYRSWGKGDLREERKRLFAELLAASFACKQLYPRTKRIIEGYDNLLQLCEDFGAK